ncbi:MAG: DUF177 domain-containing protein [Oscillospiraceae bacterium]
MFIVNLEQIFNNEGSQLPIEHKFDMSDYEVGGVKPIVSSILVTGIVKKSTGIVSVCAKAEFEYSNGCDRCATPVTRNYIVPVNHTLVTELNDESNDNFTVIPSMRLDLDELVTEDILLFLPSKFLCKDDCKGICAICGKNFNEGSCSCEKPIDPRLEVLKQLLDK